MDRGEHSNVRDKLDLYAAGLLNDVEWLTVRTHLAECPPCREELAQPPYGRALPRRILAAPVVLQRHPPGWPIVFGTSFVAALVAFGIGYALSTGL